MITYFAFGCFRNPNSSVYRNPIYHQAVFAIIMITAAGRTAYVLRHSKLAAYMPEDVKSSIARIFSSGAAIFALGFFVWNLDNIFCNTITGWKQAVGWPAAFLLEGHSWWHILTVSIFCGVEYLYMKS